MKRILLVDDEPLARAHIRKSFPWEEWNCEIIGEAENGAEALELCGKLRPDVALIDITMPVMDGFALLDHMTAAYPNTKSIMLTAHREFAYAQKAMAKGAFGYILKSPIDLGETKAALERISIELAKEISWSETRTREQRLVESNRNPLRRHFFQQLLTSVLTDPREIKQRGAAIGIALDGDHYLALVCQVDALPLFAAKYPDNDQPLVEYTMLEIVRESLQPMLQGRFEMFPVFFGRFVILVSFKGHLPDSGERTRMGTRIEARLNEPLTDYLKLQLTMAASLPFAEPQMLKAIYRQTEKQLVHRFYQERPHLIQADACPPLEPLPGECIAWLNESAGKALAEATEKAMQRFLSRARTHFLQMKPLPGDVVRWFQELRAIAVTDSHLPPWPDFREAVSLFDAIGKLEGWFQRMQRVQNSKLSVRSEIGRALHYIHQHLQDELSLDSIASEVELSPSHLGHLFKKEVGTSVIDYVLEQRIELAKKYLAEGRFRNYELAEKVGFRYYSYFSTMFKKMTGHSPNEFRRLAKTSVVRPGYHEEKG